MPRYPAYSLSFLLMFCPALLWSQLDSISSDPAKVYTAYITQVSHIGPDSVDFAYMARFEGKKVEIPFVFDDSIATLEDISFGEDELEGPECFIPEMKIAFYKTTYIISFYCSAIRKYKNSAPYTASSVRMKNDIPFTYSVNDFLMTLHNKFFDREILTEAQAAKFVKQESLGGGTADEDMRELEAALQDDDGEVKQDDEKELIENEQFNQPLEGDDGPTKVEDFEEPSGMDEESESAPTAPVQEGNGG